MNVLFDTHLLLWALTDDDRLPQKARDILMDTTNNIYYSVVSIWEIAIKHQLHPDVIDFSGLEISVFCDEAGFLSVPLKEKHRTFAMAMKHARKRRLFLNEYNSPIGSNVCAQ